VFASILATEAIRISLPDLESVAPEAILAGRTELAEQLVPFRAAMYQFAMDLERLVGADPTAELVRNEATFMAKTKIIPLVSDLRHRLQLEGSSIARKLVVRSLNAFALIANYLIRRDVPSLATVTAETGAAAADFSDYQQRSAELRFKGAVSYLAALPGAIEQTRKAKGRRRAKS
jgi:hypothetical protein